MKSIRTMTIVALCSAVTALGTIAYVANRSNLVSYFSGDPKVCINCHTMNTHYATWQHSSHREFAACADCHLPSDPVNKLLAKARDGFNHSVAMTLGDYGNNLMITDHAADRIQANCINCHEQMVSQLMANQALYSASPGKDRNCWDCHRTVPHGTLNALTASEFNLGVKEL
ncbi:MAG: cytochrome c nitrite reductase small subunit [Desulfuromonadales bacterium]|nr:cytochrome c nitrite reductase small subunit [Desulfuromonadales bacterium]